MWFVFFFSFLSLKHLGTSSLFVCLLWFVNFIYIYITLFMPIASAYHLENLLNDYLGCEECKLLKSKSQVFLHQKFFKKKAIIISRLYGSFCLNNYVPNTFILGDSCVRMKALRKSVTGSYKVNKKNCVKVFFTVFILCVLSCVSSEESEKENHPPMRIFFWFFFSFSSPFHIMYICSTHEYTCLKKRFHSSDGALLVHIGNTVIKNWSDFACGP